MRENYPELKPGKRPLLFGEVLFDHFPDGHKVLGGAPFNVAWHLQGFGLQPLFISRLGEDAEAADIIRRMDDWGMDVAGLQLDPERPSGRVNVSIQDNEPSYFIEENQAWDLIEYEPLQALLAEEEWALLYQGSLGVRHPQSAATLARLKQDLALATFVDINIRPPFWQASQLEALLQQARWLKLNRDELIRLGGTEPQDSEQTDITASIRQRWHLEMAILTLGDQGARLESAVHQLGGRPPAVSDFTDAVGAGDAFTAIVLLGLIRQWSFSSMLARALAFSSAICAVRGAVPESEKLYQDFIQAWSESGDGF